MHYLLYYNATLTAKPVQAQPQINAPAAQTHKKPSQVDHVYVMQQVITSTYLEALPPVKSDARTATLQPTPMPATIVITPLQPVSILLR